jgi:hypothetical protein
MNLRQITIAPSSLSSIVLGSVVYANGQPSGYTLEELEMNPAERKVFVADLPLVPGAVVAQGERTSRVISAAGMIVGADAAAVRSLRRNLIAALLDTGGPYNTITVAWTDDGVDREVYGNVLGEIEFTSTGSHFVRYRFSVVSQDPNSYSASVFSQSTDDPVVNAGNADTWPTFVVVVDAGETSVTITSSETGEQLVVENVSTGNFVVISTVPGFESLSVNGVSAMDKLTAASRFVRLKPGSNSVTVSGGSGTVYWRDGWSD